MPSVYATIGLIGETGDLRQRIKEYISGTQKHGNKLWRETFLNLGDIRLDILTVHNYSAFDTNSAAPASKAEAPTSQQEILKSNSLRILLEQLLIQREISQQDDRTWIVNART